jgi:hypothetical protein
LAGRQAPHPATPLFNPSTLQLRRSRESAQSVSLPLANSASRPRHHRRTLPSPPTPMKKKRKAGHTHPAA